MGVSRTVLINRCVELFAGTLSNLGFSIGEQSPVFDYEFWFAKHGLSDRDKLKIIEFQPSG
jgi:hypothetical protein